jgi:hypothetical protein
VRAVIDQQEIVPGTAEEGVGRIAGSSTRAQAVADDDRPAVSFSGNKPAVQFDAVDSLESDVFHGQARLVLSQFGLQAPGVGDQVAVQGGPGHDIDEHGNGQDQEQRFQPLQGGHMGVAPLNLHWQPLLAGDRARQAAHPLPAGASVPRS